MGFPEETSIDPRVILRSVGSDPTAAEAAEWIAREYERLWTMAQPADSKDRFVSWDELDPKEREMSTHVMANYERWRGRQADDG